MMKPTQLPLYLVDYQPASVLELDLVHHSQRPQQEVTAIQAKLEQILATSIQGLRLQDTTFNYTGDGYLITLCLQDAARLVDFLNATAPRLQHQLKPYAQYFRIGADFGLVNPQANPLTGAQEHFSTPGIIAARLEEVAAPGQILVSPRVFELFRDHYPAQFSPDPLPLQGKDRFLTAHEFTPVDLQPTIELLSDFIYKKGWGENGASLSDTGTILAVDDERAILRVLKVNLELEFPGWEIQTYEDPRKALELVLNQSFDLIITDIMMPHINGFELLERVLEVNPEQRVAALTALADDKDIAEFLQRGGLAYITKPFEPEQVISLTRTLVGSDTPVHLYRNLQVLCKDIGGLMVKLSEAATEIQRLDTATAAPKSRELSLLRHKMNRVVREFLDAVFPGADLVSQCDLLLGQLKSLIRFCSLVEGVSAQTMADPLQSLLEGLREEFIDATVELDMKTNPPIEHALRNSPLVALCIGELIDNALTATSGTGVVSVTIHEFLLRDAVRITVRDTGPGVPEEVGDRLFEHGVSSHGAGRGLGLSLIREAIGALDGAIEYSYQEGAVFRITLPRRSILSKGGETPSGEDN